MRHASTDANGGIDEESKIFGNDDAGYEWNERYEDDTDQKNGFVWWCALKFRVPVTCRNVGTLIGHKSSLQISIAIFNCASDISMPTSRLSSIIF